MKGKLLTAFLLTSLTLLVLVSSTLTNTPAIIPDTSTFGSNLNKTISQTITITNNGTTDVSGTLTPAGFVYSAVSLFPDKGLTLTFNPAALTIPASDSETTLAEILVPYNAYMGLYTNQISLGSESFILSLVLKSSDYSKNLRLDIDGDSYPGSIRVGSDFIIKKENNFVENKHSTDDAQDVEVEAWLYDNDDNKIVSKDSFDIGKVKDKDNEEFDDDLELVTDGLNPAHSFNLYIRAYSRTEPEKFFVEKNIDSIDVKSEEDLCEAGDLEIDDLDEDDIRFHGDKISPGEKIIVPVTVTNIGSDSIDDVVIRAWICEDDTACTWDDAHLDDYKISRLDAQDLGEDDEYTFEIPLEIPDDADDGDYRLRAEAYERSDEDANCIGDDISIEIEKEDEEILITSISLPEILACGEEFTADIKLENIGNDDLEDLFIKVYDISGKLGINKLSESFDLNDGKSKRETFSLKIPAAAKEGDYTFIIATSNGDEDSVQKIIKVQGGCIAALKVSISASLESDAVAGQQAIIKATLTNMGEQATYTITTSDNQAWSTTSKVEPSSITLNADGTGEVLIYLNLNDDSAGERTFNIQVTSAGQVTEQPVSLTIQSKQGFSITGSSIFENLQGNWFIWVIVAINVILIIAIIIVASRLSK